MDTEDFSEQDKQIVIPVDVDKPTDRNAKIVYAIPAKPKPKPPWWYDKFGAILLLIYSIIMMVLMYGT